MGTMLIFQSMQVEELKYEDGRCAAILEVDDDETEEPDGIWVKVISWSEKKDHVLLESAIGKRVLATVQIIDDALDDDPRSGADYPATY
jgi:hypothetical protein